MHTKADYAGLIKQKRRDAHKKATIDFDKVYDDRKRYLDAGIGDEFAGWRADIERLPDRFARPFQSRPRGASRPVRLGLPGRFGVRTGCQFPQVCPPPCRSATSGAPGTNLGYLTDPRYYAARTAYFRCGKFCSRLRCFSVFRPRSAGVSARRSARVCLGRRSLGRNLPRRRPREALPSVSGCTPSARARWTCARRRSWRASTPRRPSPWRRAAARAHSSAPRASSAARSCSWCAARAP